MVGWYVGAIINVTGSISINLGTNVMKLGHNQRAQMALPEEKKPPIMKNRYWQVGLVVFILGNIANFASFGFAAQSLLAALGSVQFVSNVVFASTVLKEKITRMVLIATACIIGGCLILVIFGDHSNATYEVEQLIDLYRQPVYISYLCVMGAFVAGGYALYVYGRKVEKIPGREQALVVQIMPVAYSVFAALLGTQSVLFSKSLSVLLRMTVQGDNQFNNWYTWVTLICFFISAGFWVTRLNKGLRMFPAMIIVPLLQICWTLFSIVSGLLYFEEYRSFNTLRACMFALGVTVVFVGVYLLTRSGQKKKGNIESNKQKEEDGTVSLLRLDDGGSSSGQGKEYCSGAMHKTIPMSDSAHVDDEYDHDPKQPSEANVTGATALTSISVPANTATPYPPKEKAAALLSSTMEVTADASGTPPCRTSHPPPYPGEIQEVVVLSSEHTTPGAAAAPSEGMLLLPPGSVVPSSPPMAVPGRALDKWIAELDDGNSMVGMMKKGFDEVGRRLKSDFFFLDDDAMGRLKQGRLNNLTLFSIPDVEDDEGSKVGGGGGAAAGAHMEMSVSANISQEATKGPASGASDASTSASGLDAAAVPGTSQFTSVRSRMVHAIEENLRLALDKVDHAVSSTVHVIGDVVVPGGRSNSFSGTLADPEERYKHYGVKNQRDSVVQGGDLEEGATSERTGLLSGSN
ncbi:hypothetical protein CEUSTIGMA_g5540.t1 [Chlamydomonas eustigma]|uniref:Probable magnesium transporter n=1 Tax=Chlamydomonas eustigma TaxID=1157962 RepID=A0A250X4V1_9CHLO|nr:hypothetical protein CEUSTIGMA_g5540.t1 [Chlamydomonas eustigma]|eukprot:GAX78098.1 hypothetical protein CEUSTIGMA_g5540.t1 [Chlamydomonas eustigma]